VVAERIAAANHTGDEFRSSTSTSRRIAFRRSISSGKSWPSRTNTQKYLRYLELTGKPRASDITFTIPRRR